MKMRSSLLVSMTCLATIVSLSFEGQAMADEGAEPSPDLMNAPVIPSSGQAQAPPAQTPAAAQPPPLPASLAPLPAAGAPAPQPAAGGRGANGERDVATNGARTPVLQPWDVDARASVHTTPLLQYGGIGASADAGMRKVGPGTFALGGGLDYFFCGTTCSSVPLSFTQRQVSLEARLSYHLAPTRTGRIDFYPLVTAGFMVSRSTITVGQGSEYRASDVAPSIGFGAGASYFFTDSVFVAAETRFRYAAGTYSYELASGSAQPFDRSGIDTWSASTVDVSGAIGARF